MCENDTFTQIQSCTHCEQDMNKQWQLAKTFIYIIVVCPVACMWGIGTMKSASFLLLSLAALNKAENESE